MLTRHTVTARANANIAFVKYWGNRDDELSLPANPSLSMNLAGLHTETSVTWDPDLSADSLILNGKPESGPARRRVTAFLDHLRRRLGINGCAGVVSANNFPMGAGIASSASAFAALTKAAVGAAGLDLPESQLTTLARLGSGSAARSIPTGFVEWHVGTTHEDSFAESIAGPEYWGLVDIIAIVSQEHKTVHSTEGHRSAATSDLQSARVAGAAKRLAVCKEAILKRDFPTFADTVEQDSNLMHAVMMTSRPPLFYWLPATLTIMNSVRRWRTEGLHVCCTVDAGPNVHCICVRNNLEQVSSELRLLSGIADLLIAEPGGPAAVLADK